MASTPFRSRSLPVHKSERQRTQRSQRRFSPSDIIDLFSCFLFSVLSVLSVVISLFCFSHHRGHRDHRGGFHLRIPSTCFLAPSSLCSLCSPWLYSSSLSLTTEDTEHTEKMFGLIREATALSFCFVFCVASVLSVVNISGLFPIFHRRGHRGAHRRRELPCRGPDVGAEVQWACS